MKSYLRFLSRNKLYTAIMAVGLSIALSFVIPMINLMADKYERSRNHERYEDIYAVAYAGNLLTDVVFGDYIRDRVPEIEHVTSARISYISDIDKEFFHFFPFEFIEGNESFLESWYNIAVSDKYAAKITDGSAVGKTIMLSGQEYNIAAVFKSGRKDILKECDILRSIEPVKAPNQHGAYSPGVTLVSLKEGHDRVEAESKILSVADEYNQGDELYLKIKELGGLRGLVRYDELPENTANYGTFMKHQHIAVIFLYIIIGLIFVVAILNYINLNVAISTSRAKENATRKLVGATRKRLVIKGLTESFIFTAICFLFGYLMSDYAGSFIKGVLSMTGFSDFSCESTGSLICVASFLVLIILTSFFAGISPSVIASRFTPLQVSKGDLRYHSKRRMSRFFIGFQTVLSVILISAVLMMNSCYREALKVDFNCDIEDVGFIRGMNHKASTIASKAAEYPEILSVGLASQVPAEGFSGAIQTLDNEQFLYSNIVCDLSGFETFGFEIIEQYGDDMTGLWLTPYTQSFIEDGSIHLNSLLGIAQVDRVAGIINGFPGTNPMEHKGVTLTFATITDDIYMPGVVFRTNGNTEQGRKIMQNILQDVCEEGVVDDIMIGAEPKMVLEILEEKLSSVRFILELLAIVMGLVVIMSMMGLLGMSIHYTNERRREIAVRKIFGATEKGEIRRNLRFYLIITTLALIPAICLAEVMRGAFKEYGIYPNNIWWIYLIAALLSFAVSIVSVLWQTLRVARTNPAEALKKE